MPSHAMSNHCALLAPTVFLVRIKTIRTKNTVMDKSNSGLELVLYKIADCVRMCFSSARNRRSARTGRRPRKSGRRSSSYLDTILGVVANQPLRATGANRILRTDEKRIRT